MWGMVSELHSPRPASTTSPMPPKTSTASSARWHDYRASTGRYDIRLPTHAEIVVIGGGIIGCSTAYHLARDHKADVRAAGAGQADLAARPGMRRGSSASCARRPRSPRCCKYSVELYKGLEAETGLDTGWKMTGCLRLAINEDRWTEYQAPGHHRAELRHGDAPALARRGEGDVAADGDRRPRRRHLAADRRAGQPLRHHPVAGQGRAHARREAHRGRRASPASTSTDGRVTAVERPAGPHRLRQGGELRRPMGAAGRRAWPASACRCSR